MHLVGDADSVIEVRDGEDREERAEGLVRDERVVLVLNHYNRGFDEPGCDIGGATDDNLTLRRIKHLLDASEVVIGNNASEIRTGLCALGIELLIGDA